MVYKIVAVLSLSLIDTVTVFVNFSDPGVIWGVGTASAFSPKICNCLLLATKTRPLATTGTRFALPPVFGHAPAVA